MDFGLVFAHLCFETKDLFLFNCKYLFMSKLFSVCAILLIATISFSQGISFFHGTWDEALEEAQKTDKIIFVDAYAKWCGPCKAMAKNVFTQEKVGMYFNENFISIKMDMEEKEGIAFGRKFPVSAYPTLFFVSGEGELIKKSVGGKQVEALITLAKNAIAGFDKSGQYVESYEAGNRDFDLMLNYVTELNKVGKPSLKISNDYLDSNPNISKDQKSKFLMAALIESDSKIFEELILLRKNAINQTSEEDYEKKVEAACLETVNKAVEFEFEDLLIDAINNYKESKAGNTKRFNFIAKLKYHELMSNYNEWSDLSKAFLKKFGKKDVELYSVHLSVLDESFSYVPESNEYASELAKALVKKEDSTLNYLKYIQLLMKCDKHQEAEKVTKEAIKKAKKREEKTNQLVKYLEYIQKEILD